MIKSEEIVFRITQPCNADWNSMKPTEKGRHCNHCAKQVLDATILEPAEILGLLKEMKGQACLRMNADKLNRAMIIPKKTFLSFFHEFYKRAALFAGLQILIFNQVKAQIKTTVNAGGNNARVIKKYLKSVVINGTVADKGNHFPIDGARISVFKEDTLLGSCTTNEKGEYNLILKDSIKDNAPVKIVFNMMNYQTFEIDSLLLNKERITISTIYLPIARIPLKGVEIVAKRPCISMGTIVCYSRCYNHALRESFFNLPELNQDPNPRPSRIDISGEGYIIK